MTTPAEIEALLTTSSAYSVDSIPKLEAHVQTQLNGKTPYSLKANKALIKLYQFYPSSSNAATISQVLVLALLEYPSTDLLALMCMIPQSIQEEEPCANIIAAYDLLDACKFKEFWAALNNSTSSSMTLPTHAPTKLHNGILSVLCLSYRSAPASVVKEALNVTDLAQVKSNPNVESVTGDAVAFVPTPDNTKRSRVFQEGVSFSAVANLIPATNQ